ncbi:hypothetical protein [Roseibium denhamense]|uniref:Cytochrome c oxidase subunit 3 n=1 Tax=Roseibium denhamense TaxID=76305 RepID=A0ABY1NEA6_9HYPH|nr:hypothetical protein [Roseibium denhamense]SMP07574.1 hypothetical protein SAMN06265374_0873 [Roseibium denhamense]
MMQDPMSKDVFTAQRPSPWPVVGGMFAVAGLIATLVVTFSS